MKANTFVAWALCISAALTGCGSSGVTGLAPEQTTNQVSITGAHGSAIVEGTVTRVVALTPTDADIVFSLGVIPVSIPRASTKSGYQPWLEEAFPNSLPSLLDLSGGVPIEEIAALEPDLIVATKMFDLEEAYEGLAMLAPVVHYDSTPSQESWQSAVSAISTALSDLPGGEMLIESTDAKIKAAAAEFEQFPGRTYTYFIGPAEGSVYIVNSLRDAGASLLDSLGLSLTDFAANQPESVIPGRAQISYENIPQAGADVILVTGRPEIVESFIAEPSVRDLDAVSAGSYIALPSTQSQSIAFPSPLSIEWALRTVIPQILDRLK